MSYLDRLPTELLHECFRFRAGQWVSKPPMIMKRRYFPFSRDSGWFHECLECRDYWGSGDDGWKEHNCSLDVWRDRYEKKLQKLWKRWIMYQHPIHPYI